VGALWVGLLVVSRAVPHGTPPVRHGTRPTTLLTGLGRGALRRDTEARSSQALFTPVICSACRSPTLSPWPTSAYSATRVRGRADRSGTPSHHASIPNASRIDPTITTPSTKTRSQGIWAFDYCPSACEVPRTSSRRGSGKSHCLLSARHPKGRERQLACHVAPAPDPVGSSP